MSIPNVSAVMMGGTAITSIMLNGNQVYNGGGGSGPVNPPTVVNSIKTISNWQRPAIPVWHPSVGWSSPDSNWDDVGLQLDFARYRGVDQSDDLRPVLYTENGETFVTPVAGQAQMVAGAYGRTTLPVNFGNGDWTVELFRLTPATTGITFSAYSPDLGSTLVELSWDGSAWKLSYRQGELLAEVSVPYSLASAVDLALVYRAGEIKLFCNGGLLGTWAASSPLDSCNVSWGASEMEPSPVGAISIGMIRITRVARYTGNYSPSVPDPTLPRPLGGAKGYAVGAWTWYNDPRCLGIGNGQTLIGWTNNKSGIAKVSFAENVVKQFTATDVEFKWDDHDNPSIIPLSDNRILSIVTGHNVSQYRRLLVPANGLDIENPSWAAIQNGIGLGGYSYSNLIELEGEGAGVVYQMGRTVNPWRIYVAKSYDYGFTWSYAGDFVAGTGERPYLKLVKTSPNRFDIFFTYQHGGGNYQLFHCYYQGGRFRAANGDLVAPLGTSIDFSKATALHDPAKGDLNGRTWTGSFQKIGTKLIGYAYLYGFPIAGESGIGTWSSYIRYSFDLAATEPYWDAEFVCDGGWALYERESSYAGGICADPSNPDRAFASVMHSGRDFQIIELIRESKNKWNCVRQITNTPEGVRNFRPFTTANPNALWWVSGKYNTYTAFQTSIVGMPI